jgi:hypothetical protein
MATKFYMVASNILGPLLCNSTLTAMSTKNISCGIKAAGAWGLQTYHLHFPTVMKYGGLNCLEPSGFVHGLYRDCVTFIMELAYVVLLAPRIFSRLLDYWKTCTPLCRLIVFSRHMIRCYITS